MNLLSLPLELVLRVADWLEPEDIFHLSLTSKDSTYLIRYDTLCRRVLLVRISADYTYRSPSIPLIATIKPNI